MNTFIIIVIIIKLIYYAHKVLYLSSQVSLLLVGPRGDVNNPSNDLLVCRKVLLMLYAATQSSPPSFCLVVIWQPMETFFTNHLVASFKILGAMVTKTVATWRVDS